ncbi:GAF domain-containing protein, partial [Tenggerimyces flavus]
MTTDNPDTVHTRDVTNHGASVPDHASTRDRQVWRTFVALADTLVADFDIADVLDLLTERSVELLEVSAAAVLLVAPTGGLEVVASTSERAEVLELFAVRTDDGPCIDCVRGGSPVGSADLVADSQRWPRFAAAAHACGFRSVHAVPLRRGTQVVG